MQNLGLPEKALELKFSTAYNINMRLAGICSDAQELIQMGEYDQASAMLNQLKYYFFEYTDTRNEIKAEKFK